MDRLPSVSAKQATAADHPGDPGGLPAGFLPGLQNGDHPAYRERPERRTPEPVTNPEKGSCGFRRFCFCRERPSGILQEARALNAGAHKEAQEGVCGFRRFCLPGGDSPEP